MLSYEKFFSTRISSVLCFITLVHAQQQFGELNAPETQPQPLNSVEVEPNLQQQFLEKFQQQIRQHQMLVNNILQQQRQPLTPIIGEAEILSNMPNDGVLEQQQPPNSEQIGPNQQYFQQQFNLQNQQHQMLFNKLLQEHSLAPINAMPNGGVLEQRLNPQIEPNTQISQQQYYPQLQQQQLLPNNIPQEQPSTAISDETEVLNNMPNNDGILRKQFSQIRLFSYHSYL